MMKRLVIVCLLTCLCFSLWAQRFVTAEEAKRAAVHYMAPREGSQDYAVQNVLAVHELKQNGHTLVYEVIFKNNASVLLAGVKSCKAIIGYRYRTGGVSVLNQSSDEVSPGMNIFLEKCCAQINYAINEAEYKNFVTSEWTDLLKADGKQKFPQQGGLYGPLLTSVWGQTRAYPKVCDGYNFLVTETVDKCACADIRKCPTGCVATAMAQIIRYWKYPLTSPYTGEQYYWDRMTDTLKAKSPNFKAERLMISRLMRDCGLSAGMHYCYASKMYGCQSFAWPEKARDGFVATFGFSDKAERKLRSSYGTKSWKAMIIEEIKRGCPVLYASASLAVNNFAECGHAYVCDGYNANTDMFHFNWGYDGEANGWYSIDDLVTKVSKLDYNWNHLERMIINIYPSYYEGVKSTLSTGKMAEK